MDIELLAQGDLLSVKISRWLPSFRYRWTIVLLTKMEYVTVGKLQVDSSDTLGLEYNFI